MLNNGQKFPEMKLQAVGGGTIDLPADLAGSFGVVLVYRGAWCPVCMAQLDDFEAANVELGRLGVKVAAFSVDDEATTAGVVRQHRLSFPVGHGADPDHVAGLIGAYVNDHPRYLQPTSFILSPDGSVLNALYSSNAMGRLTSAEVARLVNFVKSKRAEAA